MPQPKKATKRKTKSDKQLLYQYYYQVGVIWGMAYSRLQNNKKADLWMQIPNPMLGNVTPMEMIKNGRFNKLLKCVESLLSGDLP